ncbi:hypothetical protein Dsin_019643 [Dipteronia sinensis]|uniref:Homeobox domain-containing protein n=1 Tax=Dipteronia sinensis TaxID=43782 RepID=A0AAE0A848_9ROSI|nr:hypothetical protein Dsin_019643 [Dipteronia sinensis]
MATYFHVNPSSEIQGADHHGMQTLYLMNPNNYVPNYSDTTLLLNPAVNALNPSNLPHAPPLMGIPLPAGPTKNVVTLANSEDINNRSSSLHGSLFSGHVHYDLWGSINQHHLQQIASLQPAATSDVYSTHQPSVSSPCGQGNLSLSLLSPKQAAYNNIEARDQQVSVAAAGNNNSPSSVSVVSNVVILESKYMRAAQELLDQVVNVLNVVKAQEMIGKEKLKLDKESTALNYAEGSVNNNNNNISGGGELTAAQKQELQLKKAKLVNMLDEVEQRYRQYHEHMKVVIDSFEQAAGLGSAKSYTALALRTISKQFRCLKDAISEQMKATSKKLGEEDCLGAKVESSRLRYVADHHDHQLRQQLGMLQHNAWRPQRGLPERAVSILRAWLFEHFLHPYPKDSDKQILAKQTGLTRSQVSNWFINARVRLWKPMVEEMYLEEVKEQDQNGNSEESGSKSTDHNKSLRMKKEKAFEAEKSTNHPNASPNQVSNSITISTSTMTDIGGALQTQQTGFNLIGSSELEGVVLTSPKKPRCTNSLSSGILAIDMDMKQGTNDHHHHGGRFGAYTMGGGIGGRFNPDDHNQLAPRFHGNGVSLTLGLPQQSFLSSHHNIQVGRGLGLGSGEADFCGIDQTPQTNSHPSTTAYDNIEIQNRKRFAAQLLPDFVA